MKFHIEEPPKLVFENGWSQLDPTEPGLYHRCNSTPWDDLSTYLVKLEQIQGELCVVESTDFYETQKGVALVWGQWFDDCETNDQDFILCFWKKAQAGDRRMDERDAVNELSASGAFEKRFERGESQCFLCGTVADYFKDVSSEERWCICRNMRCDNHDGEWTPHGVFKTLLEQMEEAFERADDDQKKRGIE